MGRLLDIVKKHSESKPVRPTRTYEAESSAANTRYDVNDQNDIRLPAGPELGPTEWRASCGSPNCAETGARMHPPKGSEKFKDWFLKLRVKGKVQ